MGKEYFNGLMAVNTWDFGSMVGKMELEYTNQQIRRKNMANGRMGKELNGFRRQKLLNLDKKKSFLLKIDHVLI